MTVVRKSEVEDLLLPELEEFCVTANSEEDDLKGSMPVEKIKELPISCQLCLEPSQFFVYVNCLYILI